MSLKPNWAEGSKMGVELLRASSCQNLSLFLFPGALQGWLLAPLMLPDPTQQFLSSSAGCSAGMEIHPDSFCSWAE